MSKLHPLDSDLEEYVIGALPAARIAEVEVHVSGCAPCAARLAREARLEVALWQVGDALREAPGGCAVIPLRGGGVTTSVRQRLRGALSGRLGAGLAVVLAAAACLALVLRPASPPTILVADGRGKPPPPPQAQKEAQEWPGWLAECMERMSLRECRAAAREPGFYVPVAGRPGDFPRFGVLSSASVTRVSGPGKSWQTLVHHQWRDY